MSDQAREHRNAEELAQIRVALGRVAVYEGMDSSPLPRMVDELVRDHEELESRIDAALLSLRQLVDNPPSPTDRAMRERIEEVSRLLKGGTRIPDTPADLENDT